MEIAPRWHHPVLGLSAAQMLARLRYAVEGKILTVLEEGGEESYMQGLRVTKKNVR